ncbi:Mss4p nuclear export [Pleurotus ostreatus]|uniref:Protein BCP1 n=1 Tax=Pleurotus ostreatus TaxID=5322 RepID=A0A8H7DXA5_PLEOS|nr:Mss4p nuclear export [Pleurotus ostreatus]KAF7437483.1 Mss4p nuclear export [Pleurotus ostreatus]
MSKRKQDDSDSDSSDVNLIDVDFDFFDPNPAVDYIAIKRLLVQLFQSDAEGLHLNELTDLILSQPTVGTTIKTDGMESDPYALLTVLNLHIQRDHPSIRALVEYILRKTSQSSDPSFHGALSVLLSPDQTAQHVGLIICERLINMPVQTVPPMYKMLGDEIRWAIEANQPFTFSHLLFVSRTYHLSPEEESYLASNPRSPSSKKSKKQKAKSQPVAQRPAGGIYPFHPEDDIIMQCASHTLNYSFDNAPREKRDAETFGIDNRGRVMLVPVERFEELIRRMGDTYVA